MNLWTRLFGSEDDVMRNIRGLRSSASAQRLASAKALAELADQRAVEPLMQTFKADMDRQVLQAVARVLAKIGGEKATQFLLNATAGAIGLSIGDKFMPSKDHCFAAACALAERGDTRAVEWFTPLLHHDFVYVRWAVAEALGILADVRAENALKRALNEEKEKLVRKTIAKSLAGLRQQGQSPQPKQDQSNAADELASAAQPAKTESPIQMYNYGVALYQKGQFKAAMDTFGQVFKTGELRMQSAYIRALCQKELGLTVETPPELGENAEDAGTVYVASNLACHIITKGHKAALTKQGSASEVTALIDGSLYVISISSLFGGFNNWAWRKEGGKSISIPDPDANPNPTHTDRFVFSLAEQAGVMPPSPMPEGGLKTTWE